MSIMATLTRMALRHYTDKSSWAGIVVSLAGLAHLTLPAEVSDAAATILAFVAGLLLVAADGRKNPNADPCTGCITPRADGSVPQPDARPPDAAPAPGGAHADLQAVVRTGVAPTQPLVRRLGPYDSRNEPRT